MTGTRGRDRELDLTRVTSRAFQQRRRFFRVVVVFDRRCPMVRRGRRHIGEALDHVAIQQGLKLRAVERIVRGLTDFFFLEVTVDKVQLIGPVMRISFGDDRHARRLQARNRVGRRGFDEIDLT